MALTRRELLGAAVGGGVLAAGAAFAQPAGPPAVGHVVLLGDSIFDNAPFVGQRQATVIDQVRRELPQGWKATLQAAANKTVDDVLKQQLAQIPQDATHVVLSAGGNDAIRGLANLLLTAQTPGDVFTQFEGLHDDFERRYRALVRGVRGLRGRNLPTVLCTIPTPDFTQDPKLRILQPVGVVGLGVYNDVITRIGVEESLPILDLRVLILPKPDHAADGLHLNPAGGSKLAERLAAIVRHHDFTAKHAVVYA